MGRVLSFILLSTLHWISRIFYRIDARWVETSEPGWTGNLRVIAFLNHTSLFEPLYLGALPRSFFWWGADRVVLPGADKTMSRPIVGTFYRLLFPKIVAITRKRDNTWDDFLQSIDNESLVLIAPEGRMKRPNGLDAKGNPMTVRGGIADILWHILDGDMIFMYSGGLHHVQAPGEWNFRIFQKLRVRFQRINIKEYKNSLAFESQREFRLAVVHDIEERIKSFCPTMDSSNP